MTSQLTLLEDEDEWTVPQKDKAVGLEWLARIRESLASKLRLDARPKLPIE